MKRKFSLMIRIMTTVNVTTIVAIVLFAFFLAKTVEKNLEDNARVQMNTLVNSIKLSTADFVWNLNSSTLKIIAEKLISESSIDEVVFLDNKEVELAKARRSESEIAIAYKSTTVKSEITYGEENQKIGFIKIMYNVNNVREFKNKLLYMTGIAILIVQLVIGVILFIILKLSNKRINDEFLKLQSISNITHKSSQDSIDFAQNVSVSAAEQASSIQETVSILHEITETVKTSVVNVTLSSKKATESFESAKHGQEVVKAMIDSIKEISESNNEIMGEVSKSNDRMKDIVNVINEITAKTDVINEIVFQTKLLSFNASVEAARAGENGKGFAVVAEEVGNLAQMSGNAAKEITLLLDESVSKVNQIIKETNSGVESVIKRGASKIEEGVYTAKKCDEVLNRIVDNAVVVKNMMTEVSNASTEQSAGVQNINIAILKVDQMIHSNEQAANKSFETAQKLADQSNELKKAVHNIETEIFGDAYLKKHG